MKLQIIIFFLLCMYISSAYSFSDLNRFLNPWAKSADLTNFKNIMDSIWIFKTERIDSIGTFYFIKPKFMSSVQYKANPKQNMIQKKCVIEVLSA